MGKSIRKVEEHFKETKIELVTDEPYLFALHILDHATEFGNVLEKENRVLAQGPVEKIELFFNVVKKLDKKSELLIKVEATGEKRKRNSFLNIDIRPKLVINFSEEEGVLKESFDEFYKKDILPELRKISKEHVKKIIKGFEKKIEEVREEFNSQSKKSMS